MGQTSEAPTDAARERILATAYDLFSHRGIRDVGIGEVIENASIAKATLYRHFRSKGRVLLEMRSDHPAGREAKHQLERVRTVIRTFAEEAGLRETERFAVACQLLVNGSIVCAAAGNADAARPAKELARGLIELHR